TNGSLPLVLSSSWLKSRVVGGRSIAADTSFLSYRLQGPGIPSERAWSQHVGGSMSMLELGELLKLAGGSLLPDGVYTLQLRARDYLRNLGPVVDLPFEIDTRAPGLTLNLASAGQPYS